MLGKKVKMNWIIVLYILIWYIVGIDGNDFEKSMESLKYLKTISDKTIKDENMNGFSTNQENNLVNALSKVTSGANNIGTKIEKIYDIVKSNQITNMEEMKKVHQEIGVTVGVANGLVSVVEGVRDKSYLSVLTGTLNVMSTILSITGPAGAIAGTIISLISFALSALFAKEQKSETKIMLEGVQEIIKENEYKKIKEKITESFYEFETLEANIIDLIQNIQPNEEKKLEEINQIALFLKDNNEKIVNYDKKVLNHLKEELKSSCCLKELVCTDFLSNMQLYLIVSSRYEIFALHLVGLYELISTSSYKTLINTIQYNSLKTNLEKKITDRNNILDYLLNQRRSDQSCLSQWKCVAEYYKYPGKFGVIDIFVKRLLENMKPSTNLIVYVGKNFDDYESFKSKDKGDFFLKNAANFKYALWLPNLIWVFVPPQCIPILESEKNDANKNDLKSKSIEIRGPTLVQVPKQNYERLSFMRTDHLSGEYFRVCQDEKMEGPCFHIVPESLKSVEMPFPAKSLYIPSGWKVNIHKEVAIPFFNQKFHRKEKVYPSIKGPLILEKMCHNGEFIKLSEFSKTDPPKNDIKICSEENFGGWCDYINQDSLLNIGKRIHECEWNEIKSYETPSSRKMVINNIPYHGYESNANIKNFKQIIIVPFNVKK